MCLRFQERLTMGRKVNKYFVALLIATGITLAQGMPAQALGDCGPMVSADAVICLIGSSAGGGGTGLKGNPTFMSVPLR